MLKFKGLLLMSFLTAGKYTQVKKATTAISILLVVALASGPAFALSGELVIEGTGDSQGILRDLSWQFMRVHSKVAIAIPESVGSSGGIEALRKRRIELARVARPLTKDEKREGFKAVVFARTPVVFVVHPSVSEIDNITSEQVVGIYSGKVTWWEELGGSRFKVYPVARETSDSSRRVIEEHIPGLKDIEITPRAKTAYSTPEAVKMIKGHKNTIGYLPMAMAHRSGLRVLKLDGVYPSVENVRNGTYPLSAPLSVVHKEKLRPVARKFTDFLFGSVAIAVIKKYGCVPEKRKQ
jgi:phosphate transport system substrate-binding protein